MRSLPKCKGAILRGQPRTVFLKGSLFSAQPNGLSGLTVFCKTALLCDLFAWVHAHSKTANTWHSHVSGLVRTWSMDVDHRLIKVKQLTDWPKSLAQTSGQSDRKGSRVSQNLLVNTTSLKRLGHLAQWFSNYNFQFQRAPQGCLRGFLTCFLK